MTEITPIKIYRIRKSWDDEKSQIGAYSALLNAQKACDKAGVEYFVFDEKGEQVYPKKENNSLLVTFTQLSPNNSGVRTHKIDRITPHCVVGQCSIEALGAEFSKKSKKASSNYGIGKDGKVGLFVNENEASWCSSNTANDQRSVTIECASDATHPYAFKDNVYKKLVELCIDICKRNGLKKVVWIEDKAKALAYEPVNDECQLTVHRWFSNKSCPGDWMFQRMGQLASEINMGLGIKVEIPKEKEEKKEEAKTETKSFKVGQEVNLMPGATYANGNAIPSWLFTTKCYVREIRSNGNIVFSTKASGPVTGVVKPDSLVAYNKAEVEAAASFEPYIVQITADTLNVRAGAGTNYKINTQVRKNGLYTIVAEKSGWGKLKSGAGWISLDYTKKLK